MPKHHHLGEIRKRHPDPASHFPVRLRYLCFNFVCSGKASIMPIAKHQSIVTKLPEIAPAPHDAALKKHHVKDKNGRIVGFRDPCLSSGERPRARKSQGKIVSFLARFRKKPATQSSAAHDSIPALPFRTSRAAAPLQVTWLGHASVYVEFSSGLRVLFGPMFTGHAPSSSWPASENLESPTHTPSDLPAVDAVCISHAQPDDLRGGSMRGIAQAHPRAHFLVPLGNAAGLRGIGIANVTEMDWWEQADVLLEFELQRRRGGGISVVGDPDAPRRVTARFSCLPCQPLPRRARRRDANHTLWASWSVASGDKSVWYAGAIDAECPRPEALHKGDRCCRQDDAPRASLFTQIGQHRGPFDLGLLPVGAYETSDLLSSAHANLSRATKASRDAKCERAVGWTWAFSSDGSLQLPFSSREPLRKLGIEETGNDVLALGESREY
ncbi:beta-lactamase superfamily domain-containing protein [Xylariaceae sp. FL0016]|nr:beta-lactamase superfamily domain-containing protein [Xylariaceae sp. FL0016]